MIVRFAHSDPPVRYRRKSSSSSAGAHLL